MTLLTPRRAKVLLIVAELLALASVLGLVTRSYSSVPRNLGRVPAAEVATAPPSRSQVSRTDPSAAADLAARGTPLRLRLPAARIDAQVVPVVVNGSGGLTPPSDVERLGWWAAGAQPGSPSGTVVIVGHVDSAAQGIGQFFRLERAVPGDLVTITTSRGYVRYRVAARHSYAKPDLPRQIFARSGRSRLVMVTCGGAFDRSTHSYADNVVVYALPV